VKDNASTIRETIESIIGQDFPKTLMEIIIVDGYSQDGTLTIIMNHLKNFEATVKIFYAKGLGKARQIVVDNAEGEYILWVDGDMVLPKDYVKNLVQYMEQHFDVGIAKGTPSLNSTSNLLGTLEACSRAIGKITCFSLGKTSDSRVLGTSGAIYRTSVIRKTGGFDKDIKGYCEDWDAELKVKEAGFELRLVNLEYLDYERCGLTWKNLWNKYWRRGFDTHYFVHKHKNKRLIRHYKMFPPSAFLAGILHARALFTLTRKKIVFLLPFQYLFKMTAWYVGYIKGHLKNYQPY